MAIKLGELFVQISARTSSFGQQMKSVSEAVEKVSKQVKQAAGDTAQLAGALTAAAGAAVLAASSRDKGIAKELQRAKDAAGALAVEIARTVMPALREGTELVNKLVTLFRQLSPETKGMIADVVKWVAIVAAGAKGVQMLSSALGVVASVGKALGAILTTGLIGPLLIAAAVAGVLIVVAGLIRQAWDDNLGGIREHAAAVWKWMGETAQTVFDFFRTGTSNLMEWFSTAFKWIVGLAALWATSMIDKVAAVSKFLGHDMSELAANLKTTVLETANDLMTPGDILAQGAKYAGVAWNYTLTGIKKNAVSLGGLMKKYMGDLMPKFSMVPAAATAGGLTSDQEDAIEKNTADTKNALKAVDADVNARALAFANVTRTQHEQLALATAGFSGFDHALAEYQNAMRNYTQLMGDAKEQEIRGNLDAALAATEAANKIKGLAGKAATATVGFTELATLTKTAGDRLTEQLLGSAGKVGGLIKAGQQGKSMAMDIAGGAAQGAAAGPIGAILGVVAAILVESEQFKRLLDLVATIVGTLADGLGTIIEPVVTLVAALVPVAEAISAIIAPLSMIVEAFIGQFIPPIIALGYLLMSLAPLIQILAGAVALVIYILNGPITLVLYLLFETFRLLARGILWLSIEFGKMWNGVVRSFQEMLRQVAEVNIGTENIPVKPFAALHDIANNLDGVIFDIDGLTESLMELNKLTWDEARAQAEAIAAQEEQTEAIKEATSALTNVPQAWKYALNAFAAMDAAGGGSSATTTDLKGSKKSKKQGMSSEVPMFAQSGTVYRPTVAVVGDGGEPEHIMGDSKFRQAIREEVGGGSGGSVVININGATNPEEVARAVMKVLEKLRFQRTGSFVQSSPRFAGG